MVVEVFLNSVYHSLVVVLDDALPDVLALKFDSLLPSSDGIHQVIIIVINLEIVLFHDMLLFSQEVVNFILVSVSSIVLLTGAGEESDDDPRKEMRS